MDIFKLVGSVYVDTDKAQKSLSKVDKSGEKTGSKLGKLMKVGLGVGAGIATAVGTAAVAMFKLAESSAGALDEVHKGAQKLNMSYEEYQKLSYACDRSGMSIESFKKGMIGLNKDMADFQNGATDVSAKYDQLGVSLTNTDGSMKSTDEVLNQTLTSLAGMEDVTQRNAIAQQIFGKSYTEMLPLLNSGADGIEELMNKADELGLVMSDDMVESGAQFQDALADVKDSFNAIKTKIGAEVMPIFMQAFQFILKHMPQIQKVVSVVFKIISGVVQTAIAVIRTIYTWFKNVASFSSQYLAPAIAVLKGAFEQFRNAIAPIIEVIKKMKEQWQATHEPMGGAEKFAKALGVAIKVVAGVLKVVAVTIKATIKIITGFKNAIMGIVNAVKTMRDGVANAFNSVYNKIKFIINKIKSLFHFEWKFPKPKMPDIKVIKGEAPWGIAGKGKVPEFKVDWKAEAMDKAQILTQATIFGTNGGRLVGGGEAGREVVSGEAHLMDLMRKTVADAIDERLASIESILDRYMPVVANRETVIKLNQREVGRMVRANG